MELDLEIFWHTDETKKMDAAGIDFDWKNLETKTITFYNIDVISPYIQDGEEYCKIFSCGDNWITPYSYDQLKAMIRDAKKITNENPG